MWVWLKIKELGLRGGFLSLVPFAKVSCWDSTFLSHSHVEKPQQTRMGLCKPDGRKERALRGKWLETSLLAGTGPVLRTFVKSMAWIGGLVFFFEGSASTLRKNHSFKPESKPQI